MKLTLCGLSLILKVMSEARSQKRRRRDFSDFDVHIKRGEEREAGSSQRCTHVLSSAFERTKHEGKVNGLVDIAESLCDLCHEHNLHYGFLTLLTAVSFHFISYTGKY